jgi:hypothetical protein
MDTKMVEVRVRRILELQSAEADVVERLVIDAEGLIGVLDQLVQRQGGIVRLHDRVRNLEKLELEMNRKIPWAKERRSTRT